MLETAETSVMPVFEYEITAHHTGGEFRCENLFFSYRYFLDIFSAGNTVTR